MAKRRPKRPRPQQDTTATQSGATGATDLRKLSRRKLWVFRLVALIGAPVFFVAVLELTLRVAGYGYPTAFLLPVSHDGRDAFVQNNRFGWRFFGQEMARWPYPFSITQVKATNVVRIVVLGESAVRGEPQPAFGLPRVLEAMLSLKYPSARFEVVNAAMTAINSHAILAIARDCARANGDIWLIYMGNNEVVGPFGAGTVFGSQTPPLPMVKASLALKAARTGQLMDSIAQRFRKSTRNDTLWGGMTLFLDQQVRADDSRLRDVYRHFERNLGDIVKLGRESGAGIVLSTVAVNLKDCPPFASAHRDGLTAEELDRWKRTYELGVTAYERGDMAQAAEHFAEAARLDDSFAELRYRQGQCASALGQAQEAAQQFRAARDYDTLRFRCDSKLNQVIRDTASKTSRDRVLFVDSERIFAEQSSGGVPGDEWFYEHVHFTFAGNYLLARILAEQVMTLLPDWVKQHSSNDRWASPAECAQRLGRTDWNEATALNSIITTLNDPPFSNQIQHREKMRKLETSLARLSHSYGPNGMARALEACEVAARSNPLDPTLLKQWASLKMRSGDTAGAETTARKELELLPEDMEGWALLATILSERGRLDEAEVALRKAFHLGPQGIRSHIEFADSLARLGRKQEARAEYERILKQKPRCVPALLQLGELLETMGNKSNAEVYFGLAWSNRSGRVPELVELGDFFERRRSFTTAADLYREAAELSPDDARLQLGIARNLASLGRYEEAAGPSAKAVRLAPEFADARLMDGIISWKRSNVVEAIAEFEEALRLQPQSLDARLNLGIALSQQGADAEALRRFEEVLQKNPSNVIALKYTESLRSRLKPSAP